jgi:hypothetical protein
MKIKNNFLKLLEAFPKSRMDLPLKYKKIYEIEYKINRNGHSLINSLAIRLELWMHKKVASLKGDSILELGAGTLNHMKFESQFQFYDVVEPFKNLYLDNSNLNEIRNIYGDVNEIDGKNLYKKVLSIATLEHVTNLPYVLSKSAKLLRPDGVFQAGIPTEGGILWYLSWRFITGLSFFFRYGLNYAVVMRHEHVNTAKEIECLVKFIYRDVRIVRFPINSFHLSFYSYIEARNPDPEKIFFIESYGLHKK